MDKTPAQFDSETQHVKSSGLRAKIDEESRGSRDEMEVDEISFSELIKKFHIWWKYLLSKWIFIVIAGLLGGILGVTYAYLQKPKYRAELSFALEEDNAGGGIGGALGLASQFGLDLGSSGGGAFAGENLLQLMKSRSMIEKALLTEIVVNGKKQTLAEMYISFTNLREKWEKSPLRTIQFLPGADRTKFTQTQDSLLGIFHKKLITNILSVEKLDKKLSIIIVKVNSENELFSKYFTEALIKEVSDFYVTTKIKKSRENLAILQLQTDSVRRALNSAISGVASLTDLNPNPNSSRQILRVPSQSRQVDVQANSAILQSLVTNLELAKANLRRETPLIQIIDKPILPLEMNGTSKKTSLIIGGFIGGFLMVIFLIIRQSFNE